MLGWLDAALFLPYAVMQVRKVTFNEDLYSDLS